MNEELSKNEILQGLLQVNSSFSLTEFYCDINKENRKLSVSFVAQTGDGEEVKAVRDYAI